MLINLHHPEKSIFDTGWYQLQEQKNNNAVCRNVEDKEFIASNSILILGVPEDFLGNNAGGVCKSRSEKQEALTPQGREDVTPIMNIL